MLGIPRFLSRHQILALAVVEQAWKTRVFHPIGTACEEKAGSTACHASAASAGVRWAGSRPWRRIQPLPGKLSPYSISRWRGNAVAAAVTVRYGLGGADFLFECRLGHRRTDFLIAGTLIACGLLDAVVAVGVDAALPPVLQSAMNRGGSVKKATGGRPLSADRSGMLPAEGAACLILESERHAASRGAAPIAEWLGGDCANEARHLMAPDPEAHVLGSCSPPQKRDRSQASGLAFPPRRREQTRSHATEVACIRRVFGEKLPWISAMKRTTGHALAASGLLEASLLAEGLRTANSHPGRRT
jgi:3-oxoacyl-(acyl-carrier-protein) synthase